MFLDSFINSMQNQELKNCLRYMFSEKKSILYVDLFEKQRTYGVFMTKIQIVYLHTILQLQPWLYHPIVKITLSLQWQWNIISYIRVFMFCRMTTSNYQHVGIAGTHTYIENDNIHMDSKPGSYLCNYVICWPMCSM